MKSFYVLSISICLLVLPEFYVYADTDTKHVSSPVIYRTVLAFDTRMPIVSDTVLYSAFRKAEEWISRWYDVQIRFDVVNREPVDDYMDNQFKKMNYPRKKWSKLYYRIDGTDKIKRYIGLQTKMLQNYDISSLIAYVPKKVVPYMTTPEKAAPILLSIYDLKLRMWRELTFADSTPVLDLARSRKHTYWHWNLAMESEPPLNPEHNLIVTNVMLIDDALSDAPPHTVIRGGLMNGMAQEESAQAMVTTFFLYGGINAIEKKFDYKLTGKERVLALAHIIGHEVGAHIVSGFRDVYGHKGCLAVPTSGLAYKKTLVDLLKSPVCRLDHPLIDRKEDLANRYQNQAFRYVEEKRYEEALAAAKEGLKISPDRVPLSMIVRQLSAKSLKQK